MADSFGRLTEAVRKGGTALSDEGTVSTENPVWVSFARAMMPMMAPAAQFIAKLVDVEPTRRLKVLDIAAGHGLFGIALAQRNPQAEIVALDWPQVLEVAQENAQQAGVSDRYHALPGSAFEVDFGKNYDLILLTNFLHHFDVATCENLLRKVYAALAVGGRVVTLEFVPNEDRVTPAGAAMFSMTMLASTKHGDAYTFAELSRMFQNTGFSRSELHPVPFSYQSVVVSDK
jgi:2-polyprenyl-3-methyl-5-hydroxy-6-metoxy-1,4-benzoquinol methylase